jgi:hypothetical protein
VEEPGAELALSGLQFLLKNDTEKKWTNNQADNNKPGENVVHDRASSFTTFNCGSDQDVTLLGRGE